MNCYLLPTTKLNIVFNLIKTTDTIYPCISFSLIYYLNIMKTQLANLYDNTQYNEQLIHAYSYLLSNNVEENLIISRIQSSSIFFFEIIN